MVRTVKLGSLAPGLNNRLEPSRLQLRLPDRSQATYLYGADNVDITSNGFLKRRRGQSLASAGAAHSLWSDQQGAFGVVDGVLAKLSGDGAGLTREAIRQGLPALPVSYSRGADGDVYWTNSVEVRRIAVGGDRPIATAPLALVSDPVLVGGALPAGRYLVALTVSGPDGESPATTPVAVEVDGDQGIAFSGLPAGLAVNLFATGANGEILSHQASSSTGTVTMLTLRLNGRTCDTLNRELMPAGSIVRHYNGRMLVASGNTLFLSDPYRYGLYDPSVGYIPFPAAVSVVEPMAAGVYIVADKTYWIGDLLADALQEKLAYGGTPGTSGRSPDGTQAFWQSPRGLVLGDADGNVSNVQEHALKFSAARSGASLYREQDGMTHIVSTRYGAEPSVAAATSYMEAEIVRKGTVL